MLNIGDRAPEFSLTDDEGREQTLRGLLAKGPLVLYFYPADFTAVCTREACMFRDFNVRLAESGVQVVGVSPQDAESHRRFKAAHELNFPLLADVQKAVVRAYDVDGPFGVGVRRVSYLIETDGRIADLVKADIRLGPHEAFLERVAKNVQR